MPSNEFVGYLIVGIGFIATGVCLARVCIQIFRERTPRMTETNKANLEPTYDPATKSWGVHDSVTAEEFCGGLATEAAARAWINSHRTRDAATSGEPVSLGAHRTLDDRS